MQEIKNGIIVIMKNGAVRQYSAREWMTDEENVEYLWAFKNPKALLEHLNQHTYDPDGNSAPEVYPEDMAHWR